jgi:hypothetical protein
MPLYYINYFNVICHEDNNSLVEPFSPVTCSNENTNI